MNYKKYEKENYNIYLIKTKKFKTICMAVVFRRENSAEDEIYRSLLTRILPLATNQYHNLDELCRAKIEIYDPSIRFGASVAGKDRIIYFESTFANEKYTETNMNEKTIDFICNYFWDPYIKENHFNKEIFDICKREYIEALKSVKDNPDSYAYERIWEEIEAYQFKSYTINEIIEKAEKITEYDLFNYYKSIFEKDCLDIFVAGDIDESIINSINKKITGNFKPSYKNRLITQGKAKNKEVIEKTDVSQAKLALGLTYDKLTDFERKYVSMVYFNLLGEAWNGKLNKVIREEHSLCYYIFANRQPMFGFSLIFSGIDGSNYNEVIKHIKEQMKEIEKGNFTKEDIDAIKKVYKNAIIDMEDNQSVILDNFISFIISDTDIAEVRKEMIDKVTKEDIKKISKKIHIDTIYLLRGEKNEKDL